MANTQSITHAGMLRARFLTPKSTLYDLSGPRATRGHAAQIFSWPLCFDVGAIWRLSELIGGVHPVPPSSLIFPLMVFIHKNVEILVGAQ